MEFQVYRKPCMLLETVELVYSYVNQVPAEQLTESGEYCIPAREIPSIREAVCGPLDLENEELQFYFKVYPWMERNNIYPAWLAAWSTAP